MLFSLIFIRLHSHLFGLDPTRIHMYFTCIFLCDKGINREKSQLTLISLRNISYRFSYNYSLP